jgi:hypothetical protein
MLIRIFSLLLFAAVLGGCAATRLDADVRTVGAWPAGRAPGSFAFERLPSQQAQAADQDKLEASALPALFQAGFKPAQREPADVLVQVAARTGQGQWWAYPDPFYGPFGGGVGLYAGRGRGAGWGYGGGWGWGYPGPWGYTYFVYEVSLLILDARSHQALYETRAQSDGAWPDEGSWAALFAAALKDFPYAAVSPRRVTIDLPK